MLLLGRGITPRATLRTTKHIQHIIQPQRTFITSPTEIVTVLTASIQTLHAYSGIPWWALIPLTTITLRTVWTLPLAILQRKRTQKQAELRPIVNAMGPILRLKLASRAQSAKQKETQQAGELVDGVVPQGAIGGRAAALTYEQIMLLSAKERRERQKKLFKEHGCQMWKNFTLPLFQIPLWLAMSATFRDLSGWNEISSNPLDDSLVSEGLYWFSDLTVADPMSILPVMLGTLALTNVEWNFKTMQLHNSSSVRRSQRITAFDSVMNMSRLGVVFLMAVSTQAPAALALYWISSNAFSTVQNMVLDYYVPVRYTPEARSQPEEAAPDAIPLFTRNDTL
jgi:inner membrane protein COX18